MMPFRPSVHMPLPLSLCANTAQRYPPVPWLMPTTAAWSRGLLSSRVCESQPPVTPTTPWLSRLLPNTPIPFRASPHTPAAGEGERPLATSWRPRTPFAWRLTPSTPVPFGAIPPTPTAPGSDDTVPPIAPRPNPAGAVCRPMTPAWLAAPVRPLTPLAAPLSPRTPSALSLPPKTPGPFFESPHTPATPASVGAALRPPVPRTPTALPL